MHGTQPSGLSWCHVTRAHRPHLQVPQGLRPSLKFTLATAGGSLSPLHESCTLTLAPARPCHEQCPLGMQPSTNPLPLLSLIAA